MPYPGYLPFLPTSLPLLGVCAEFLSLQWPILPAFLVLLFRVSSAFYIAEGLAPPWFGLFNALIYMYMKVRAVPSRSEPLPRLWHWDLVLVRLLALGKRVGVIEVTAGLTGWCNHHPCLAVPPHTLFPPSPTRLYHGFIPVCG